VTQRERPSGSIELLPELQRAVERQEFGLEYLPIIDLQSGAIAGVEALLRWRHPLLGIIPPSDYLPLAEETGLIVPIGERVLDVACRQLRTWQLGFARMQSMVMSVNVGMRQLEEPGFVDMVGGILGRADLEPGSLVLELSGPRIQEGLETLGILHEMGIRLAIDDFGAADTLRATRVLPVDVVKLDGGFVALVVGPPADAAFAEALLEIGRARNLETIGKGVETREQARRLQGLSCDRAQGYLYSKPLGPEGIGTLLARGQLTAAPRSRR
jgi:EAL domain-containing protein (putative c-di-GMP-specific phosphodiesterase class I)